MLPSECQAPNGENSQANQGTAMQRRHAFTLVEMIVAMGLTLFIMVIVSTAFVTGLETFRQLKGLGDMQEGLRTATQRLRYDLVANHFEGRLQLSNPYFQNGGKPAQGYFRIEQMPPIGGNPAIAIQELQDLDSPIAPPWFSYRATSHRLQFTVRLIGNRQQDQCYANIPATVMSPNAQLLPVWSQSPFNPNGLDQNNQPTFKRTTYFSQPPDIFWQRPYSYTCQWAEVGYHLVRTGSTADWEDPTNQNGTPLYSLYRIQKVMVPDSSQLYFVQNGQPTGVVPYSNQPGDPIGDSYLRAYGEMSCEPDSTNKWVYFNTPYDVAQQTRSFAFPPSNALEENNSVSPYSGASLLLTNIISFQVQVLYPGGTDFQDIPGGIYDTAQGPGSSISAIKITLRVWDPATVQTRQITMIQQM
jgi:hypothetical protein